MDILKVVAALNSIFMAGLNGFEEDDSIFDQSFDPFDLVNDSVPPLRHAPRFGNESPHLCPTCGKGKRNWGH